MGVIIRHKVLYPVIILVIFIATAHAGEFKVFKIYDGDSFAAIGHDIEIKVRLMGMTPLRWAMRDNQANHTHRKQRTI